MKTELRLHTRFEECEAEDLIHHHRVQARCHVIVLDEANEVVGRTSGLGPDILAKVQEQVAQTPVSSEFPEPFDFPGYSALAHKKNGFIYIELVLQLTPSLLPAQLALPDRTNNIYRFSQQVCESLYAQLNYDRVMVYRFHPDFSGEVIAETREESLEPFLGLHYPATDIPSQARALYASNAARIIYTAVDGDHILELSQPLDVDQSALSCRGVSPYHLQYLANMGSLSTASVAINVDGKLWGLISLHRKSVPTPDLHLHPLLRNLSERLSAEMSLVLTLEQQTKTDRAAELTRQFMRQLDEDFDAVPAMLMSNHAIHRLIGGVGTGLIAGDVGVHVGATATASMTRAIVENHVARGDSHYFCNRLSEAPIPFVAAGIGGYAFCKLGTTPPAGIVVYRREVAQSVAWGGDPRRESLSNAGETVRYTPRGSFERWVETVQGSAIAWDESAQKTLMDVGRVISERFAAGAADNLGLVLAYSATQLVNGRDRLRTRLNEQFNRQQQSIAIAIEDKNEGSSSILSINEAASQAFNVSQREAEMMPLERFAEISTLPLNSVKDLSPRHISVWTHDLGSRDLEVKLERHLEYRNDTNGKGLSILIYFLTDITEARRVELALQSAFIRTQRNAEIQSQVNSKLMHELRTPLNSILGFSTFLSDPETNDEDKKDFIERIVHNANLLKQIVDSSDEHRRSLKQQIDDERELLDLSEIASRSIRDLSVLAAERGINLQIDDNDRPIMITAAPNSVEQILINLVNNAIKFSEPADTVAINIYATDKTAKIEVRDSGIGMTPEQIEQATVPFKRFTERPGSGLGLSIVKQLIAGNDGELSIFSEIGKGTTMAVTLPLTTG